MEYAEEKISKNTESSKIQWHPAFYAAMQMEFRANKGDLEFQTEVNLTKKPLQMDLLIIKKLRNSTLKNPIGGLFDKYNIVEYKSPEDSLNIDTFYKVNAYACLYKVLERNVDEYKVSEITISLVRSGYPRELINRLRAEGYRVECKYPGIYYVSEKAMFATQIIVTSLLDEEESVWLQALKPNLKQTVFQNLSYEADSLVAEDERQLAQAVLEVATRANEESVEKWKEANGKMGEALRKLMAPELKEARESGLAEGRTEGTEVKLITQVSKKIKKGKDVHTIADELEEEIEVVERICEAAKDCGPEYDVTTIYNKLKKMIACL